MSEPSPLAGAIGSRLRQVRRQQELSLADVEERSLGACKAVALSAYERGVRGVTVARLAQLASLYEVPVSTLLAPSPKVARPIAQAAAAGMIPASGARSATAATTAATTEGPAPATAGPTAATAMQNPAAAATTSRPRPSRSRRRTPLAANDATADANGRGRTLRLQALLDIAAGDGSDAELLRAVVRFVEHITQRRGDHNGRVLTLRDGDLTTIAVAVGCRLPELLEVLDAHGVTSAGVPSAGATAPA
ncbi:helix-turn-helix domain-containing protein [Egicoccus sp. AB-alg6-2]|uniref:helix-turn-helix domain-containing protein n=1 Tax=Egicoccus sp. AB-alg6-2 TaxID=3242692 RepID=UPI00359EC628